jgi:hypothetical protein
MIFTVFLLLSLNFRFNRVKSNQSLIIDFQIRLYFFFIVTININNFKLNKMIIINFIDGSFV